MSWPAINVEKLPLVLAGPLLRKVSSTSVSVWLALKSEAFVVLTVKDASGKAVAFTDPIGTVRIGANLQLAFLTAGRAPISSTAPIPPHASTKSAPCGSSSAATT